MTARKKIDSEKELKYLLYIVSAVLLILLSIFNLRDKPDSQKVLGANTSDKYIQLVEEKKYWEEFLSKNPTYHDGWIRLADIEYKLGDNKSGKTFQEIANRIDSGL